MDRFEFYLPDIGEGLHEAEIRDWLVQVGETVRQDQPLVEVETDKAAVEIPAPYPGRILSIGVPRGEIARVGDLLVVIDRDVDVAAGAPKTEPAAIIEPAEPPRRILASPVARKMARELGVDLAEIEGSGPAGRIMTADVERAAAAPPAASSKPAAREQEVAALPRTRRLARELDVDITRVAGSGPAGRVTDEDVRRHAGEASPAAGPRSGQPRPVSAGRPTAPSPADDAGAVTVHVPLRGLRRSTARRMDEAWRVPHVTVFEQVDATHLVSVREALKPLADRRNLRLTYMPLLIKIVVQALREFPNFNATLDMEREEIHQHHFYHVGMATSVPDGLVVPVIRHVERLSVLEIAAEVERLGELAHRRTLAPEELRGGTFTVTNFGSFGGWLATPIINPPEVAILGVGRIEKQAVVVGDEVVVKPRLPVVLSFDHRVIDGHDSGRFMQRLGELLERPEALLLELR